MRPTTRSRAASVVLAMLVVTTGCATRSNETPVRESAGEIAFVDIDSFDAALAEDLRRRMQAVTVRFPNQPATVNSLPPRLQKWLSAVHRHGGGVTVETADGYSSKDVLSVVSVLVAGYKLVRDNMPALLGRQYRAVIRLKDTSGNVERVDFVRIDTVESPVE